MWNFFFYVNFYLEWSLEIFDATLIDLDLLYTVYLHTDITVFDKYIDQKSLL